MTFNKFIATLSKRQLIKYAESCGTSPKYILGHLKHRRRVPKPELLHKLWKESNGKLTKKNILEHFYPELNNL